MNQSIVTHDQNDKNEISYNDNSISKSNSSFQTHQTTNEKADKN